jgi:hypothetical protein
MKSKSIASAKKSPVKVPDLKTKKNPKGGGEPITGVDVKIGKGGGGIMKSGNSTLGLPGR